VSETLIPQPNCCFNAEQVERVLDLAIRNGALDMPLTDAIEEVRSILAWQHDITPETRCEVLRLFESIWCGLDEEHNTTGGDDD
jgi:hypothetical protein